MKYDSILTAVDSTPLMRGEYYAIGQQAPDIGIAMSERAYAVCNDDWIVGGLVVMAFVLTWLVHRKHRLLVHHFKDFFSIKQHSNSEQIKDNASEVAGVLLLATISAVSLSLIYFNDLVGQKAFTAALGIPYWVLGMGFVAIICFIYTKAWAYTLINWVFFDPEQRHKWIVRYFSLTSFTAFVLYPISVADVLTPITPDIATWGVILTWLVYEILLFYRLLTNFISKKHVYPLFLLYFCSVELIPALILWKGLGWASDYIIVNNILY